jgi:hypothetical protein
MKLLEANNNIYISFPSNYHLVSSSNFPTDVHRDHLPLQSLVVVVYSDLDWETPISPQIVAEALVAAAVAAAHLPLLPHPDYVSSHYFPHPRRLDHLSLDLHSCPVHTVFPA